MNRHPTARDPQVLRAACLAAGLALAPWLAHGASAGWLARPMRPRSAPVTAALRLAPGPGRADCTTH